MLLFIIPAIFAIFGSDDDSLFKFTIKKYFFAQIAVRWCLLAAVVLCLFANPFMDGEVPVYARIIMMYVIAAVIYILMIFLWGAIGLILKGLHSVIMWACNVDSD